MLQPNPNFWRDKTVVVSGATGFLGGWLIEHLLKKEAKVVAIVRGHKPESQFFMRSIDERVAVESADISDVARVKEIFERYPVDVFFHTAYGADVNRVLAEPMECFRSTAWSTWQILDYIRLHQPHCISVISSTDKVYGRQPLPYREEMALQPLHPYEVAKASQDLTAQSYGKVFGSRVAVTRCGNYFGGYDFNFTRLIPGVVRSVMQGEAPSLRSNGRFTRDFLYIEDAADVQMLVAERLAGNKELHGEAFNFSYGEQLEVIDLVRQICGLLGSKLDPVVRDDVTTEIPHMHLSSDKAKRMLQWEPSYGFQQGLERTVDWYRNYFLTLQES